MPVPAHDRDEPTGRHEEFVQLFSRDSWRLYRFILSAVLNHNDAEDILQNTSVVLWNKFDTFQPSTNFLAWACRIAEFEVFRYRRQKRSQSKLLSDETVQMLARHALTSASSADARQSALVHCLEKLGQQDRELIRLRYHDQMPTSEIAAQRSRSIYSIYRALGRIHAALLRCVQCALAREDAV